MPLPPEVLEDIKRKLDEAEDDVKGITDVLADLRAAGIDALKQEEALAKAKENLRHLRLFYERQSKRQGK